MNSETLETLIPIVMFIVVGVIFGLFYYYRFRARAEMQATVRTALEKGQELNAELIERLGEPRRTPESDLRRGVIAIGLSAGIAAIGVVIGEPDALRPILAGAVLPLFIGLAYLALWWFTRANDDNGRQRH